MGLRRQNSTSQNFLGFGSTSSVVNYSFLTRGKPMFMSPTPMYADGWLVQGVCVFLCVCACVFLCVCVLVSVLVSDVAV